MLLTSTFLHFQRHLNEPSSQKSKCATLHEVNTCKLLQKFVRVDSIKPMQNKIAKPGPRRQREAKTKPTGTPLLLVYVVYVHMDSFSQNKSERNSLRGLAYIPMHLSANTKVSVLPAYLIGLLPTSRSSAVTAPTIMPTGVSSYISML